MAEWRKDLRKTNEFFILGKTLHTNIMTLGLCVSAKSNYWHKLCPIHAGHIAKSLKIYSS